MPRKNLARALFLVAVALFFGATASRYPIGTLAHAGPGLFPLLVSGLLLIIAIGMLAQSVFTPAPPLYVNARNITLIMLSLGGFVLVAQWVNAALGIAVLVFVASLAAPRFDWRRSLGVSVGLVMLAAAFERFLGLNLGLF